MLWSLVRQSENSPEVRAAACASFGSLGLALDASRNISAQGDSEISSNNSTLRILVLKAQEDWMIAKEWWKLSPAQNEAR